MNPTQPPETTGGAGRFVNTPWTDVLLARAPELPAARDALERLCRLYWYPVYAHIRPQSKSPQDAEDATQEFFRLLIEKNYLGAVDRQRGKFRSFLLVAVNRFLLNARKHDTRLKRGGGQVPISLDAQAAENRYLAEPATSLTPDKAFERRWAETVLDQARSSLRQDYIESGKREVFDTLERFLGSRTRFGDYAEAARILELTPGAVAVAAHRLRQRYRESVREAVRPTVASPSDIESEMHHLFELLCA